MSNMQRQSGFTLIELVVVIVILGILAAVAVPRFVNLEDEAAQASVEAIAGNLESAASINFAKSKANKTEKYYFSDNASSGGTCDKSDFNDVLQSNLPTNATLEGTYYDNCTVYYEGASQDFGIPSP